MDSMFKDKRTIFLLVFPGLVIFIFAVFLPIVLSVYYGTTSWNGMSKIKYVGLDNFIDILFHDPIFWQCIRNVLLLSLGLVLIQHPVCIFFAILINSIDGQTERIFRTIFFIPCTISVVVTSKLWLNVYNYDFGLLNKLLDMLHLGTLKQDWLGNQNLVIISMLVIIMWQGFGWGMLYYYAGLKNISPELYEAARIDGCGIVNSHFRITIPLLKPIIRINMTLAVISAFKQMETIFLTTNGGPGNASQFIANYLYKKAFDSYQYGYGNAISVIFVIICISVTILFERLFKPENNAM
jgi:raffinose/stachyose/melibiose transport system permease protein